MPEVFGMRDFLKPLPRDDDDKKAMKLLKMPTQLSANLQPQTNPKASGLKGNQVAPKLTA